MCSAVVKCIKSQRSRYDVIVVGGGIIGTAVAHGIKKRYPNTCVALLEKEESLGQHQSSHNSGVIHAGLYYPPKSLKAKLCVEGARLVYEYCDERNIPYLRCGKLIVATDDEEAKVLNRIHRMGLENRVPGLELLRTHEDVRAIEPKCKGTKVLWSPFTGNIDWKVLTQHLANEFEARGGNIKLLHKVSGIRESDNPSYPVSVYAVRTEPLQTKYLIKCGGLHSSEISKLTSSENDPKILSFRVDYKILKPMKESLIQRNIYAVPNLPFLGPHLSPMLDGNILVGPTAVPAFSVEGYSSSNFSLPYLTDMLGYSGFQKMFLKNLSQSLFQLMKFTFSDIQTRELKRIVPLLDDDDISPGPAAVQAQAINDNGEFIDDYIIDFFRGPGINRRIIDCKFIPSPGATSCLSLSQYIVDKLPTTLYTY